MERRDEISSDGEESGWTSYLQTTSYCNNYVSFFSESSTSSNCSSNKTVNLKPQKDSNYGEQCSCACNTNGHRAAAAAADDDDAHHKIGAGNGNAVDYEGVRGAHFPDAELKSFYYNYRNDKLVMRAGSSSCSLWDASNSSISLSQIKPWKRFYPRSVHQRSHPYKRPFMNPYKRKSHAVAANHPPELMSLFEDTATSSPSSSAVLLPVTEDTSSFSSSSSSSVKMQVTNCDRQIRQLTYTSCRSSDQEEGSSDIAVSTRFQALEALIPRLKEVAGKGKEEEVVKVIERHVRALELQVELLSSIWELIQLEHQ